MSVEPTASNLKPAAANPEPAASNLEGFSRDFRRAWLDQAYVLARLEAIAEHYVSEEYDALNELLELTRVPSARPLIFLLNLPDERAAKYWEAVRAAGDLPSFDEIKERAKTLGNNLHHLLHLAADYAFGHKLNPWTNTRSEATYFPDIRALRVTITALSATKKLWELTDDIGGVARAAARLLVRSAMALEQAERSHLALDEGDTASIRRGMQELDNARRRFTKASEGLGISVESPESSTDTAEQRLIERPLSP